MKKTRLQSLIDSVGNTAFGFGIGLICQWFFLPLLGVEISIQQNFIFAMIMTAVSVARGYVWSRFMEWAHVRTPLSASFLAVIAERQRQKDVEGWTEQHDDGHVASDLARAGACYALANCGTLSLNERPGRDSGITFAAGDLWRWGREWWKPADARRNLVRAAALIIAELDRMDRARKRRARLDVYSTPAAWPASRPLPSPPARPGRGQ